MAMSKFQPWIEEFDAMTLRLLAGGFIDFLTRRNVPVSKYTEAEYDVNDEDKLEPYKIEHIMGPMISLASGLFIAMLIFCLEITSHFINGWLPENVAPLPF